MADNPFEIPKNMRDLAEQNMKQAHAAYDQLTDFVTKAMGTWMVLCPQTLWPRASRIFKTAPSPWRRRMPIRLSPLSRRWPRHRNLQEIVGLQNSFRARADAKLHRADAGASQADRGCSPEDNAHLIFLNEGRWRHRPMTQAPMVKAGRFRGGEGQNRAQAEVLDGARRRCSAISCSQLPCAQAPAHSTRWPAICQRVR